MDKEQIKAISESIPMEQRFSVEQIVSAAIASYKAELLKEVGEPVGYSIFICGEPCDVYLNKDDAESEYTRRNERYPDKTRSLQYLFTSDQVAAATLKATKPLEERIKWLQDFTNKDGEVIKILEDQLAAAQEEIAFQKSAHEQAQQLLLEQGDQLAKAEQRVAEYNELIYAVQTKNPDETRHQTALRYIRNAENRPSNTAANGASS